MFDRIVCITDLEPASSYLLDVALNLRDAWADELDIAYVHENPPETRDERALFAPTRAADLRLAAAERLARQVRLLGPRVRGVLFEDGDEAGVIGHAARADLVVMRAPARPWLPLMLSAPLIDRIVRSAKVPVLVVPSTPATGRSVVGWLREMRAVVTRLGSSDS